MNNPAPQSVPIAIACGGTGGHLFPGLAVAEELARQGCALTLIVSPKEVDQHAVRNISGMEVLSFPAVGLRGGRVPAFILGMTRSYVQARRRFKSNPPVAALAMGGFTGVGPIYAAKRLGARTFLHESNTVPGRANRWLARMADEVFVGFPQASESLRHPAIRVSGTPVRRQFQPRDSYPCRVALGLDPARPVLLIMGGSQGASAINELVLKSVPYILRCAPELQFLHLAGRSDVARVEEGFRAHRVKGAVHAFMNEMELALGAATLALSRAGASSLAELAAMNIPAILIPYPAATGNHQWHNARAYQQAGAALMLEQSEATPQLLARMILELLGSAAARQQLQCALAQWHVPNVAAEMADAILRSVGVTRHPDCCSCEPQGNFSAA